MNRLSATLCLFLGALSSLAIPSCQPPDPVNPPTNNPHSADTSNPSGLPELKTRAERPHSLYASIKRNLQGAHAATTLASSIVKIGAASAIVQRSTQWDTQQVFDREIRISSLHSLQLGDQLVYGFDTPPGEVWIGFYPDPPKLLIKRAQLGALSTRNGHTLLVTTLEREADAPAVRAVTRPLSRKGTVGKSWRPNNPGLWAAPGERVLWLPAHKKRGGHAMLIRARRARAQSLMTLWWVPLKGAATPLDKQPSIPQPLHSIPIAGGSLSAVHEVVRTKPKRRELRQALLHADPKGNPRLISSPPELPPAFRFAEPKSSTSIAPRPPPFFASQTYPTPKGWISVGPSKTHEILPDVSLGLSIGTLNTQPLQP